MLPCALFDIEFSEEVAFPVFLLGHDPDRVGLGVGGDLLSSDFAVAPEGPSDASFGGAERFGSVTQSC